jgi:hypothetical protein
MVKLSFLLLLFCLASFSSFANDAYEEERKAVTKSLEIVRNYIDQNHSVPAKDGFLFTLETCKPDDLYCFLTQANMLVDKKYAYEGVYTAQRNVAFCLTYGCDRAVFIKRTLGCAWRIVILASGSPLVDSSDVENLRHCLEGLDDIERATMRRQAVNLFRVIYDEELPAEWR